MFYKDPSRGCVDNLLEESRGKAGVPLQKSRWEAAAMYSCV